MINHRTDLFNYPYFMLQKICELDPQSKRSEKNMRVVNVYNNGIGRRYIHDGDIHCTKKALKNVNRVLIIWR